MSRWMKENSVLEGPRGRWIDENNILEGPGSSWIDRNTVMETCQSVLETSRSLPEHP